MIQQLALYNRLAAPDVSVVEREHARRDVEVTGQLADFGAVQRPGVAQHGDHDVRVEQHAIGHETPPARSPRQSPFPSR